MAGYPPGRLEHIIIIIIIVVGDAACGEGCWILLFGLQYSQGFEVHRVLFLSICPDGF